MRKWKGITYLVMVLLLLEVAKSLLSKIGFTGFYFYSMIAVCLQFFFLVGFILYYLVKSAISKFMPGKKRGVAALTIVLLFFVSGELLFGFWLNNPRDIPKPLQWSYWYYYDYYDCRLIQYQKGYSIYDSSLFYRLNPYSNQLYENREFKNVISVNSKGLRDSEISLDKPDVICLGDSYAMGWGVEQQQAFPEQLGHVSGLRVLNAGISSYGTAREIGLLKQLDTSALRFVIIQYCSNDIIENTESRGNNYHLKISSEKTFDSLQAGHFWVRKYFPGKYFCTISLLFLKHQVNKLYPFFKLRLDRQNPVVNEEEHALYFLDVLCNSGLNSRGVNILVTMMDSYPNLKNNFLKEVEKLARKEPFRTRLKGKVIAVDVRPVLDQEDFYLLDLHIKASGHRKIAEALWEAMQKN